MVANFSCECLNSCHWLAPVLIWRAANQGVTRLGSRGNMELFLILWRSRYNMTTRSRPGRGETGKKLSKGSQAMSVTREETGETTYAMNGGCTPEIWNFSGYSQSRPIREKSYKHPSGWKEVSSFPKPDRSRTRQGCANASDYLPKCLKMAEAFRATFDWCPHLVGW